MSTAPVCRTVTVHTFRGERTLLFRQYLFGALADERAGRGPAPTRIECLLFLGHTGVSTDVDATIYGFSPDGSGDPMWQVMDNLRTSRAYPGVVLDDSAVFAAAANRGLLILTFDVILPEPVFEAFQRELNSQQRSSPYTYGFPDGDGDCNCTTWLERLGLPLLTGRMDEFTTVAGVAARAPRRFGLCN